MERTIKDYLNEDWDYVDYRIEYPKFNPDKPLENSTFAGCFAVKKGQIIPLDHDTYSPSERVLYSETWSDKKQKIKKGLTIIVPGVWMS